MIVDTMERIALYEGILPHAKEIAELFKARQYEGASVEIRDKRYDTKPDAKRRFEVHAHTIDLMIGFEGSEIIHICPQAQLEPAEALPGGADGMKMNGAPQGHTVQLLPGTFAAIYPGEAHMVGGQAVSGLAQPLHKWVVKIPLDMPDQA
ncbi:MAG: YhcH/YjgK/YiaL family protein [Clostridia bacterium]|nr:YhcH/YjgK/YiaL family protein [Clostridia bacterium]